MITTVLGEIPAEDLGMTSAHEHLLIDLRPLVSEPETGREEFFEPLTAKNRYLVNEDPYAVLDNARMESEDDALAELAVYKKYGGGAIVDVTTDEIARNPMALKRLSAQSGVHIVMGCGRYIDGAIPQQERKKSVEELTEEILRDVRIGVHGTDVKAGVIGEIGTSAVVTETEWRSVRAAANAAAETGLGVHIHTALWERNGLAVADEMTALGVKPHKIAINHIDVDLRRDYNLQLAEKGVFLEFDNFGKEFFVPASPSGLLKGRFAYDLERVQEIVYLVKQGFVSQILVANDICLKNMLTSYGGNGYAHLFRHIIPMFCDAGLSESEIETIFVKNPARFLDGE
ncbi:MAG: phosphotriesterase [Candidatus Gallimonas sp.]